MSSNYYAGSIKEIYENNDRELARDIEKSYHYCIAGIEAKNSFISSNLDDIDRYGLYVLNTVTEANIERYCKSLVL